MRIFDTATTRDALPFERLIPALRAMFQSGCQVPPRHVHVLGAEGGPQTTVLIMPAWQEGGLMGIKTVNIAPHNSATAGKPGLHSTYLLYDAVSGEPLAQIDGNEITSRRTAAASALAASYLAREDARHLLVVGSGRVASLLPAAYRAVRPIETVSIWNVDPAAGRALAERLRAEGFEARCRDDLTEAVRQADVVACATLATEPLVRGAWLAQGSHLDLIGSFTPAMREADDDAFISARLYIDTAEALQKSGELLDPMTRGVFRATDVAGTLEDLCKGKAAGRGSARERTVFKSVGTALEDLAAASLVYQHGSPRGAAGSPQ